MIKKKLNTLKIALASIGISLEEETFEEEDSDDDDEPEFELGGSE